MTKKLMLLFIACVIFLYSPTESKLFALEVMILHTNDHHGSLFSYWHGIQEVAGLAERGRIIDDMTIGQRNFLLLDAGDFNTGIYESLLFDAEPDIVAYNIIGYDAMTLGNHEFYGDLGRIKKQIAWADFAMLSANVFTLDGEPVAEPYVIFSMPNGLSVAVFGLTTTHKALNSDFVVKCDVEIAKDLVPKLRSEADIVIALTHLGIYDLAEDELYGSIRLASNVSGIDLIIDGDSHTLLEEPIIVHGTPIVQSGERGRHIGKAILNFDTGTRAVNLLSWEAIPMMREFADPPFEVNPKIFAALEVFRQKAIVSGNEMIGYSNRDFRLLNIRNHITALGRVVGESLLSAAAKYDAEIAVVNSGAIRADLLRGEIRYSNIHNILPFDDEVVVLELPGTVLLEIITVSYNEKTETGAFLQYSNNVGIIQRPPDVVLPNLSGVELQADKVYRVATSTYLADGGDDYTLFEIAHSRINTGILTRDALVEYIRHSPFFREAE